jgi:translation initiation factor 5A
MAEFEIDEADAGASEAASIPVNKLRKGGYVLLEGRPCRVVDIAKSKTGKHGHAKANIAGTDIFTGKRYEAHLPTSHDIEVPFISRQDYTLLNIDDNATQLLGSDGNTREDVYLPNDKDFTQRIQNLFDSGDEIIVTVISALDESAIIDVKKALN